MELIGHTVDVIGKVMIAYTALAVHYRVRKEHKIDNIVFSSMKKEHWIGVLGIILIVLGYFLRLPSILQAS
jgi:hypothetical protein